MYWEWKPYVPVAQRRAKAARAAKQLAKKRGRELKPIAIEGRKIARTFWGAAWCDSLEGHSDFANRLPRGRSYVRNGSVIDLDIARGRIDALVSGSELYTIRVDITALKPVQWKQLKSECSQSIDSLLDLLAGRFSDGVMQTLTHPERGLFPLPKEIKMSCSCPDWAVLCKHVAAVLYAVGARLDVEPQLLFLLRGVDHTELVNQAVSGGNLDSALSGSGDALVGDDLGAMFGIELDDSTTSKTPAKRGRSAGPAKRAATTAKREGKKKAVESAAPKVVAAETASATKKSRSPKSVVPTRAKRRPSDGTKVAVLTAQTTPKKTPTRRRGSVNANK